MLAYKSEYVVTVLTAAALLVTGCAWLAEDSSAQPLTVFRQKHITSLEQSKRYGIKVFLEEDFSGDKFVTMTICMKRTGMPKNISAYFSMALRVSVEHKKMGNLLAISQHMFPENEDSEYYIGRFRIKFDLLTNMLFGLGYWDMKSGTVLEGDWMSTEIDFQGILEELVSDERTFVAGLDALSCEQPSGRYIHRR